MRILYFGFLSILCSTLLSSCELRPPLQAVLSPNGEISIEPFIDRSGQFGYRAFHNGEMILDSSRVSFDLYRSAPLSSNLEVVLVEAYENDSVWEQPWGEQRIIRDHHNGLQIALQEKSAPFRAFAVEFNVFNDGYGMRYHFAQDDLDTMRLMEEHTDFQFTEDPECWWQPGDWDIYEHLYTHSKLSEIDAFAYRNESALAQTYIPDNAVNTPVTLKLKSGVLLSFHEAALTDYSGMTLKVDRKKLKFTSQLVGSKRVPWKVERIGAFKSPWRTVIIADESRDLLSSTLILNLNEPNKLENLDWIIPSTYSGIWWEMHLGTHSWDMASGQHGATTERAKEKIDFCAKNDIDALLIEGWNTGWEGWLGGDEREGLFDFVTPYPDYNLQEVSAYAKSKGVELIMHHETSAAIETYENQMDSAFKLMKSLGINYVKTGYVGKILPKGEFHHGQFMVRHYRKVLEKAAEYEIALDVHEPIKATGIRRTYPNMLTREGLRGQEFNAWAPDGGNPPSHLPTVVFTRMLGGPVDYTPGIVELDLTPFERNSVQNTIVHQLASYIVIYSPLQMAPDLIEHYNETPTALELLKVVPQDWDTIIPLKCEIGEYVILARKAKDSGSWFIGGLAGDHSVDQLITLGFLDDSKDYELIMLNDAMNTDLGENRKEFLYTTGTARKGNRIAVEMKKGGGFVAIIHEKLN